MITQIFRFQCGSCDYIKESHNEDDIRNQERCPGCGKSNNLFEKQGAQYSLTHPFENKLEPQKLTPDPKSRKTL